MSVCVCQACTCEVRNEGDYCSEPCRDCDENAEVCLCDHPDCAGGEVEEELFDESVSDEVLESEGEEDEEG